MCVLRLFSYFDQIHLDPGMIERIFRTDTLTWVFCYHFYDQVAGLVRYTIPEVATELEFTLFVLLKYHDLIMTLEERSTSQNHVEYYACAEYV